MNDMRNGALEGLEFDENRRISKIICTVCCEGKQIRLTFPQSNHKSKQVLEKIHANVCGQILMENKSIDLSRYKLFVDDYSRI